jgi:hypothetical protein
MDVDVGVLVLLPEVVPPDVSEELDPEFVEGLDVFVLDVCGRAALAIKASSCDFVTHVFPVSSETHSLSVVTSRAKIWLKIPVHA